jgi:hypothetical protein
VHNIEELMDKTLKVIARLDQVYNDADIFVKRELISSIFPEKLIFDGSHYRTTRINETIRLTAAMGAGFDEIKKWDKSANF